MSYHALSLTATVSNTEKIIGTKRGQNAITCPVCDDVWMHQVGIRSYDRPHEDEEVTRVIHSGNSVRVDSQKSADEDIRSENPSGRRQGLIIEFGCEMCDNTEDPYELAIYQHKGTEFIEWL